MCHLVDHLDINVHSSPQIATNFPLISQTQRGNEFAKRELTQHFQGKIYIYDALHP